MASFHLFLGQRGEPGAGPPAFEQPPGRGLGPQAAARPVYRDLCPGHWQHAAQPVPGGLVCSGLPSPSGAAAALCDHLPPGGSWGRKDTGRVHWQDLAPAPQQCHHALNPLQTQGAQWRTLPAESSQDTHANVLPTSARRTHPRSQWAQPRDIHLSTPKHSQTLELKQNSGELKWVLTVWRDINKPLKKDFYYQCWRVSRTTCDKTLRL